MLSKCTTPTQTSNYGFAILTEYTMHTVVAYTCRLMLK